MIEEELNRIRFKVEETAASIRFYLDGRLDIFNYLDVLARIEAMLEGTDEPRVIVDLSEVEYVASSGWSIFFNLRKKLVMKNGKLALCGMQPEVGQVYIAMSVEGMVPAFETLQEAEEFLSLQG